MSLLVTGTVGIDTVETPHGRADEVLGGSAAYFSVGASLLTPPRLVAVVGDDFPAEFRQVFPRRKIDDAGLEVRQGAKTFRWHGRYVGDMNSAQTLRTDLNVVAEAPPKIPDRFRDSEYVFLANTHPAVQSEFIKQLVSPKLIICDTMNLWIEGHREALLETLSQVDGVILNDGEARLLSGETDLTAAGLAIIQTGPTFVIIKRGAHGSMLVAPDEVYELPAYPTKSVMDPTGAGDTFASGVMGYIAAADRFDGQTLRAAMACGTCIASITIESFSLDALLAADKKSLDERIDRFNAQIPVSR